MKYWDTSAVVPLLVGEPTSSRMDAALAADPALVTWWGTLVACTSALARQRRNGAIDASVHRQATARLERLATSWIEVPADARVREHAVRLLRTHPLRASDAMQLAAAIVAADSEPPSLEFVTLDSRQAEAAEREGFRMSA